MQHKLGKLNTLHFLPANTRLLTSASSLRASFPAKPPLDCHWWWMRLWFPWLPGPVYWTDDFHRPKVSAQSWQGLGPPKLHFQDTWALFTPEGTLGMLSDSFCQFLGKGGDIFGKQHTESVSSANWANHHSDSKGFSGSSTRSWAPQGQGLGLVQLCTSGVQVVGHLAGSRCLGWTASLTPILHPSLYPHPSHPLSYNFIILFL